MCIFLVMKGHTLVHCVGVNTRRRLLHFSALTGNGYCDLEVESMPIFNFWALIIEEEWVRWYLVRWLLVLHRRRKKRATTTHFNYTAKKKVRTYEQLWAEYVRAPSSLRARSIRQVEFYCTWQTHNLVIISRGSLNWKLPKDWNETILTNWQSILSKKLVFAEIISERWYDVHEV